MIIHSNAVEPKLSEKIGATHLDRDEDCESEDLHLLLIWIKC